MTEPMPTDKGRIAYVDLMKGICIFLIVLHHSGLLNDAGPLTLMLDNARIPLYYFLAGLFVSTKRSGINFVINKVNRLVVPYVFFNVLWILCAALMRALEPAMLLHHRFWLSALANAINSPTWFLLALFWGYMAYYWLLRLFEHTGWRRAWLALPVALLAALGVLWSLLAPMETPLTHVVSVSQIPNGLVALPFIFAGNATARWCSRFSPAPRRRVAYIVVLATLWFICSQGINTYHAYQWGNSPLLFYPAALSGIAVIYLLAQWAQRIPGFSFIGRYSIVVLGTHDIILMLFRTWGATHTWLAALTVFLFTPLLIEVMIRWLPRFTAQKDLIPERPGKGRHSHGCSRL